MTGEKEDFLSPGLRRESPEVQKVPELQSHGQRASHKRK
jgi:hypothetical protein